MSLSRSGRSRPIASRRASRTTRDRRRHDRGRSGPTRPAPMRIHTMQTIETTETTEAREEVEFHITSDGAANWYLRKLANLEAEKQRVTAQAATIVKQLEADAANLRYLYESEL